MASRKDAAPDKTPAQQLIDKTRDHFKGLRPAQAEFFQSGLATEWEVRKYFGSYGAFMQAMGFTKHYAGQPINSPHPMPIDQETTFNLKLKRQADEITRLKALLNETEARALTSERMQELIGSLNTFTYDRSPDWLKGARVSRGNTGTPMLELSDVHFDEIVKPEQIGHCNEYNRLIATRRIKNTFHKAIMLTKKHLVSPRYDGFVCALGGDMLSGNIHEELAETNEASINQSMFALTDLLINGIGELADEFGKVFVPCVVGNHGRLHKKPRAKNRVFDNFEWVIYQMLARYFKNDSRVTFQIPDGPDALFNVYALRFCLTHGDQFRGGAGIAGIFSPLMLGMARKQKRQSGVKAPFDIMMLGHFHQLIETQQLIVNGSVKGYDEYAYLMNFGYEPAQQAFFIVRPDGKITYRMPIFCD